MLGPRPRECLGGEEEWLGPSSGLQSPQMTRPLSLLREENLGLPQLEHDPIPGRGPRTWLLCGFFVSPRWHIFSHSLPAPFPPSGVKTADSGVRGGPREAAESPPAPVCTIQSELLAQCGPGADGPFHLVPPREPLAPQPPAAPARPYASCSEPWHWLFLQEYLSPGDEVEPPLLQPRSLA